MLTSAMLHKELKRERDNCRQLERRLGLATTAAEAADDDNDEEDAVNGDVVDGGGGSREFQIGPHDDGDDVGDGGHQDNDEIDTAATSIPSPAASTAADDGLMQPLDRDYNDLDASQFDSVTEHHNG